MVVTVWGSADEAPAVAKVRAARGWSDDQPARVMRVSWAGDGEVTPA
jgi:hypothetical protein